VFSSELRSHLTYANVMATVAVFVALGGSSYAALKITGKDVKNNSLTGADIKNLTGKDVKNNSLTGADVRKQSLQADDFMPGQLPAGSPGLKGDPGTKGDKGEPGLPGTHATALFATVSSGGVLRSGTATAAAIGGAGVYEVTFPQAVNTCSVIASAGVNGLGYESSLAVELWAEAGVALNGTLAPNKVRVFTWSGTGATAAESSPFSIAVFC
jgi:hypothetical protein